MGLWLHINVYLRFVCCYIYHTGLFQHTAGSHVNTWLSRLSGCSSSSADGLFLPQRELISDHCRAVTVALRLVFGQFDHLLPTLVKYFYISVCNHSCQCRQQLIFHILFMSTWSNVKPMKPSFSQRRCCSVVFCASRSDFWTVCQVIRSVFVFHFLTTMQKNVLTVI